MKLDNIDGQTLASLNASGMTYSDIAKRFQLTRNQVAGRIDKWKKKQNTTDEGEKSEYEQGDDFIHIVCDSERMFTKDDIVKKYNIDLNTWEIKRFKIKTSEGYRKDRKVIWKVENGTVLKGDVNDTGKMLVVPLYHLEVRFELKQQEVNARNAIELMIDDAKKYSPKYPKINYKFNDVGCLYEIDMQDIHFGRLTWDEESGESYDIKLAQSAIETALSKLLGFAKNHNINKVLLPVGNDFFNVDNKLNTTSRGTPQQEDTRWQKTFKKGREICVWMIDACSQIAPVDVLIIAGNHDQERSFYLGDSLDCWYHSTDHVSIDNSAMKRKYYSFGKNLIGFAHGYDEKLERLPYMMAVEKPDLWAKSIYREWHTGDKHNKKDLVPKTDEGSGMIIRILRSLAVMDAWTYDKGYHSLRASEAFLWHPDNGLVAQYTAIP